MSFCKLKPFSVNVSHPFANIVRGNQCPCLIESFGKALAVGTYRRASIDLCNYFITISVVHLEGKYQIQLVLAELLSEHQIVILLHHVSNPIS